MTEDAKPSNQSEPPSRGEPTAPAASGGVPTSSTGGNDSAPAAATVAGSYSSVDTPAEKPSGTTSDASPQTGESSAVAERGLQDPSSPMAPIGLERTGMFGVRGSGDTSGYGGLVLEPYAPIPAERPYGGPEGVRGARDERSSGSDQYGQFDEVADALAAAMA